MKSCYVKTTFSVCALWMFSSLSQASDLSESMCAKTDQVVFSCPLVGGKKVVSLCAAGDVGHEQGRFYYAYGRLSAPELVFPSDGQHSAAVFSSSHLVYGGASGGSAYSFVNKGYRYIVYSVSGTGFDNGGVLVQPVGALRAAKDMKCQQGKITESTDDAIGKAIQQWKSDPQLELHGLPRVN